jgi:hypothetical protein
LIALIRASSRVVVNFFLPICQSRIFVILCVREKSAIFVPPYVRIYGRKIP